MTIMLTGEAAKFAEELTKVDQEALATGGANVIKLDEDDQKDLFFINLVFQRDPVFKGFIKACVHLYNRGVVNDCSKEIFTRMRAIASDLSERFENADVSTL